MPSKQDLLTYQAIAKAKNYRTNCPITLIAGRDPATGSVKNIYAGCTPMEWKHYKVQLEIKKYKVFSYSISIL